MKLKFKKLAVHDWVAGTKITESIEREQGEIRRFTVTIRGWQNWKIFEEQVFDNNLNKCLIPNDVLTKIIIDKVKTIRDRIDSNDETVFNE